jgi:23S rRNA C2498 (ribose-2'-O)-methylase RlmM
VLGELLNQIPQDEQIDSVYTDGANDTKQSVRSLQIGKRNGDSKKKCETMERNKEELVRSELLKRKRLQAYGKGAASARN